MTSDQLIGKVIASYLRDRLTDDDSTGVARYLLDCLSADQTAAVAKTILDDVSLSTLVEIKLPIRFVGGYGLPAHILTNERTTYFRNAACSKSALLVANTGDDEEQSLKDCHQMAVLRGWTRPYALFCQLERLLRGELGLSRSGQRYYQFLHLSSFRESTMADPNFDLARLEPHVLRQLFAHD